MKKVLSCNRYGESHRLLPPSRHKLPICQWSLCIKLRLSRRRLQLDGVLHWRQRRLWMG